MKPHWTAGLPLLLAAGLGLLVCLPAHAGGCATSYSSYSSYSSFTPTYFSAPSYVPTYTPVKTVVKKVEVPTYIPVAVYQPFAVAVPVYSAGYYPPPAYPPAAAAPAPAPPPSYGSPHAPAAPPAAASAPDCKSMGAAIEALRRELEILKSQRPLPPPMSGVPGEARAPAPPPTSHPETMRSCAACHDRTTAEEKGAGFVLTDGGRIVATPQQRLASLRMVMRGKMPLAAGGKPAPLPNDRGAAVVAELSAQ